MLLEVGAAGNATPQREGGGGAGLRGRALLSAAFLRGLPPLGRGGLRDSLPGGGAAQHYSVLTD